LTRALTKCRRTRRERGEGQALAGRHNGEAGIVGGQIDLADEGVGRLDIGYAGKREFLAETILQRPERALRTASQQRARGRTPVSRRAMRRIGPDMLDAELLERPADLGRITPIDLAASFLG
jgi:hypothetical protein